MALVENSKDFLFGKSVCPKCKNLSLVRESHPSTWVAGLYFVDKCLRCEYTHRLPGEWQGETDI